MSNSWQVLTLPAIQQLDNKLAEAVAIGYAEITLVIEKGKLRWIRGPTPSEPVQMDCPSETLRSSGATRK